MNLPEGVRISGVTDAALATADYIVQSDEQLKEAIRLAGEQGGGLIVLLPSNYEWHT